LPNYIANITAFSVSEFSSLERMCTVYKKNPHTIEDLQQDISAAVISVSEETLAAVVRNFRRRLQMVLDADGAHTENVLEKPCTIIIIIIIIIISLIDTK
jgi:hypothetical protein